MDNGRGRTKNDLWKADIKAAKELLYSKDVIDELRKEPDPSKRNRILTNARMGTLQNKRSL